MDNDTEPRDFEIEGAEEATPDGTDAGEVEVWEPIQSGPRDFEIRSPKGQASQVIHAGNVDVWVQVSTEKTRQIVALSILGLFASWVLVGLIIFTITGNAWLLASGGVLVLPLKYVFDYYFGKSEHSEK